MAHIKLLKKQKQFLQSKSKIVAYIGGVGAGKTFIAAERIVQLMLAGGYVVCVAASYKQLKLVLFQEVKDHLTLHKIPFEENKGDMILEVPATRGRAFGFSLDSIENARGVTVDAAVLDEAALLDRNCYEVVSGRLRRGKVPYQIYLTSTPRGRKNWLYDLVMQDNVELLTQPTSKNKFLPPEYLEQLKLEYSGQFAKQELEAEFVDGDGYEQFISLIEIKTAAARKPVVNDNEPIIAGLDVARYGDDSSAIVARRGHQIVDARKFDAMSIPALCDTVMDWAMSFGPEVIVVDGAGIGAGAADMLRDKMGTLGKVVEFNGAHRATRAEKFCNARTESWFNMRDWLYEGGCLPSSKDFECLADLDYFVDRSNRLALESKEVLRRRGEGSPDLADALSMTFADISGLRAKNLNKIKQAVSRTRRRGGFVG